MTPSGRSVHWFELNSIFVLKHSEVRWHDLPVIDLGDRMETPRAWSTTAHPLQKSRPSLTRGVAIPMPLVDWNTAEVFVSISESQKSSAVCYRLAGFFARIGSCPERIWLVKGHGATYEMMPLSRDEMKDGAKEEELSRRFRTIYSFNFRAIAGSLIKSSVGMEPLSLPGMKPFSERLKTAGMGGFEVEFLQVLFQLRKTGGIPYEAVPDDMDFIRVFKSILGVERCWADAFIGSYLDHASSEIQCASGFTYWKGTGRYDPLGGSLGELWQSGAFHAVSHLLKLGFIRSTPLTGVVLTSSGRRFIDSLPNKLHDPDAPIRLYRIDETNVAQSDIWLRKHFELMKRAVSKTT